MHRQKHDLSAVLDSIEQASYDVILRSRVYLAGVQSQAERHKKWAENQKAAIAKSS